MFSRFESWLAKQRAKCNSFPWSHCASRPDRAASAEFSFTGYRNWTPEARHNSLPRRQFTIFFSERNIGDGEEQTMLKLLLKEHGLYNKHQTIHQRRRLKYLLELEQRTLSPHDDTAIMSRCLKVSANNNRTCPIEVHSMPFHCPRPATGAAKCCATSTASSPKKVRRVASLPSLASTNDSNPRTENPVNASHPTIAREAQERDKSKCLKTISWKNSASSDTPSTIETAV
uniref:Uncharacterized protein n=1 Tax=Anopheles gambiae TaxID=7165 RepID=A0A0E4G8A1_ANOGA